MSTYAIIIERGETGTYGAWCPDIPGCVAVADDQDECLQLMRETVEFHIQGMRADPPFGHHCRHHLYRRGLIDPRRCPGTW